MLRAVWSWTFVVAIGLAPTTHGQVIYLVPAWAPVPFTPTPTAYYLPALPVVPATPSTVIERYYITGDAPAITPPANSTARPPSLYAPPHESAWATVIIRQYFMTDGKALRPLPDSKGDGPATKEYLKTPEWREEFNNVKPPKPEPTAPSEQSDNSPTKDARETKPEAASPSFESEPNGEATQSPAPAKEIPTSEPPPT